MNNLALIVAAGRGTRAASRASGPKQYVSVAGRPILRHTLDAIMSHSGIDAIQVVIHPDDLEAYEAAINGCNRRNILRPPVSGGATRQQSVLNGLEAIAAAGGANIVLIHDAARPLLPASDIDALLKVLSTEPAALLAAPVADTLKRVAPAGQAGAGRVVETIPRAGLWRALTPQGFRFDTILAAHRDARLQGTREFTDDAAVAEAAGIPVVVVPGTPQNIKITTPEDFDVAEQQLMAGGAGSALPDIRTGQGFDVHRFGPGDAVWLCGIEIPHTHALEGHSDADVALHALTDAVLGALADGDIGAHFPPSDPQWKGAASDRFLADAARRVAERGGRIANVDVTILCELPKIGPHRDAMRERIAEILDIETGRVAVKATTTERLGFTGRKEGIAAMAVATIILPAPV